MKKETILLFILLNLAGITAAYSCLWCSNDQPIPLLEQFAAQARDKVAHSSLLSAIDKTKFFAFGSSRQVPSTTRTLLSDARHQFSKPTGRFYKEYLETFYPRANVIVETIFPTMCPAALDDALAAIAYFIYAHPWRYFVNNAADMRFVLVHIEILHQQLVAITEGLSLIKYNQMTGSFSLLTTSEAAAGRALRALLARKGLQGHQDLDALHCDYIVQLAYIATLFQEYTQAYYFYEKMQRAMEKLLSTRFEHRYAQIVKLYGELLKMLAARLWGKV